MKSRVTLALLACIALSSVSASAQMSEGEKKAAARAAYMEGVALQEKGNPAEALARFEAAQKLFDAPTHLLRIAECQALTGKLVEASETYETLIHKSLGSDAPDAFVRAQEQGKVALEQLKPRIPTMRVTVKPDPQSLQDLQININDKQMPAALVNIARPVNPGRYRISAAASGWATPQPVETEVREKETKRIELVLQQGAAAPAAIVVPPAAGGEETAPPSSASGVSGTPPPYEHVPPKPKESPSSTGLLLGLRPGVFVPVGEVVKDVKFQDFATAGPGAGIDVIARVARLFLAGGTLEIASLGPPDPDAIPGDTTAEVSTSSVYAGVLAGIMPNVDRVTFVADAGLGMRFLSQTITLTPRNLPSVKFEESLSGVELAINAGVSIPAGPFRIVPKAGLAFGQFGSRSCSGPPVVGTLTGCVNDSTAPTAASHTVLNVALGVYYNLDFSKKSGSASSSRFFTTAAAD